MVSLRAWTLSDDSVSGALQGKSGRGLPRSEASSQQPCSWLRLLIIIYAAEIGGIRGWKGRAPTSSCMAHAMYLSMVGSAWMTIDQAQPLKASPLQYPELSLMSVTQQLAHVVGQSNGCLPGHFGKCQPYVVV